LRLNKKLSKLPKSSLKLKKLSTLPELLVRNKKKN
jgi:hypothetical protein